MRYYIAHGASVDLKTPSSQSAFSRDITVDKPYMGIQQLGPVQASALRQSAAVFYRNTDLYEAARTERKVLWLLGGMYLCIAPYAAPGLRFRQLGPFSIGDLNARLMVTEL